MGRYYTGDIEGKFWFAVQDSDDGEYFGAEGSESNSINYYADNLHEAEEGIKNCKEELGEHLDYLKQFFNDTNGYNNEMIIKYYKEKLDKEITEEEMNDLLKWYARLELGQQITDCIREKGSCSYEAEL